MTSVHALPWDGTQGRHLFIDVAVCVWLVGGLVEPASPAMTSGARLSAEHAGVAADLRAQKKHNKYRAGVLARFGACFLEMQTVGLNFYDRSYIMKDLQLCSICKV